MESSTDGSAESRPLWKWIHFRKKYMPQIDEAFTSRVGNITARRSPNEFVGNFQGKPVYPFSFPVTEELKRLSIANSDSHFGLCRCT